MKKSHLLSLLVLAAGSVSAWTQVIPGRYIAVFQDQVRDHVAAVPALAAQHGLAVAGVYQHALKGFAFAGTPQAAAALARRPGIAYVEPDQIYQAWQQTIPTGISRAEVPATGIVDGVDDAVDVDIAIVDTGIASHPDLRVVGGRRFYVQGVTLRNDAKYSDDNGHGTHVAGTAAAVDNGFGVVGVAPGARLWAVKVLDRNGNGYLSAIIAGVDWVTANAHVIEVANMSLGGSYSQAINDAVKRGTEAGIVFVVAAGNEGSNAAGYSPASEPSAITVSALADSDGEPGGQGPAFYSGGSFYTADDTLAPFSNYGAVVDICAPGVLIYSTYLNGGYNTFSGTSMASPHVAGAAALYMAGRLPRPSVADVTDALLNSGWSASDTCCYFTGDRDLYREPLLNVAALVGPVEPPDNPPTVEITSPADGAKVVGTVTITAEAADVEGDVASVQFFLNGSSLGSGSFDVNGGFWFCDWDTTAVADGLYTLTAVGTDALGQTGASAPVTVTVDNVEDPPVPTVHCAGLTGSTANVGANWNATVVVTIADTGDIGVGGVTVSGTWSGGFNGNVTGTTDAQGNVSFKTGTIAKKQSSVTFTLTGVSGAVVYDPSANDASSLTINKP